MKKINNVTTLQLHDLEKIGRNLYEIVVATAKRARQINESIREEKNNELGPQMTVVDEDVYDEEEFDNEALKLSVEKQPKPVGMALEEMVGGKVKINYVEEKKKEK
jgi:DNA-directed RNA polymerase omega subunit